MAPVKLILSATLAAALMPSTFLRADAWSGMQPVDDEKLANMRGGFQAANGAQFSFGIERAVSINGELVTTTRLVLADLGALLRNGTTSAQLLGQAFTVVQNGAGNTVDVAGAAGTASSISSSAAQSAAQSVASGAPQTAAQVVTGGPGTASSNTATSPSNSSSTSAAGQGGTAVASGSSTVTVAPTRSVAAAAPAQSPAITPVLVQSTGTGQVVVVPNAAAIVTAVQNTVNNQIIQTRTTIDATLNSLSILRSDAFAASIRQQALDSIRR